VRQSETRLYAFVHLCATGLTSLTVRIGELQDLAYAQVADATHKQMMVHVSNTPIPLVRIFDFMRPGDVATHILKNDPPTG
jgi:predicted amidohydrolase